MTSSWSVWYGQVFTFTPSYLFLYFFPFLQPNQHAFIHHLFTCSCALLWALIGQMLVIISHFHAAAVIPGKHNILSPAAVCWVASASRQVTKYGLSSLPLLFFTWTPTGPWFTALWQLDFILCKEFEAILLSLLHLSAVPIHTALIHHLPRLHSCGMQCYAVPLPVPFTQHRGV